MADLSRGLVRPSQTPEPVAIVGLAGRFPGARNADEFWQNLLDGVESIAFFDEDALRAGGVPEKDLRDPNYVRAAPVIEDFDRFDAEFFGVSAREAQILDPQFRLFLETCGTALQHAGLDPRRFGGRVGVYAGSRHNAYLEDNVTRNAAVWRATGVLMAIINNHTDYLSTGVAYRLGLTGPAISMVTACSTSLVAIHTAVRALRAGECDAALAGGVELALPMISGYTYSEGGIFSPDGHVRTFDARARGTVFGSGAGAIVLKRLADALADRDTIHAVIRGSAVNNDGGDKLAFAAPSKNGQVAVVGAALRDAGVDPAGIGYVEAHGTGTAVGDPIEVGALAEAFGPRPEHAPRCAISSVKSNVGHLGAAAGVAGLIKAVYCLKEGLLPPAINFNEPNPRIDFDSSPFHVPTTLMSWDPGAGSRLASVSSFGIGGTNAHVILEQAPAPAPTRPVRRPYQLLTVSARTEEALDEAAEQLGAHLAERSEPPEELADIASTLSRGRAALRVRRFAVAADHAEAARGLGSGAPAVSGDRTVTFLFPGQGAQHPGMARDLYDAEPVFRQVIDDCAATLRDSHGLDLHGLLFDSGEDAARRLGRTANTQPALFAVEYALARLLRSYGLEPAAMAGHSIGEYVAAALAGVFDPDDALRLVAERGALMQSLDEGAMAAVTLPEELLWPILGDAADIAAVNAPGVCVISGTHEAVADVTEALAVEGVVARPLHTSHAFHSRMMDPILDRFRERVAEVKLSPPAIPYVSNVTGTWVGDAEATDPDYWVRHLRGCVRFSDSLRLLTTDGDRALVEVGPGRTLSALVAAHSQEAVVVTAMRHPQQDRDDVRVALEAVGQVWAAGAPVDWDAFWSAEERRTVPLPTYPYQRRRYWVDPDEEAAATPAGVGTFTGPFTVPVWRETPPPSAGSVDPDVPWVVFAPDADPAAAEFARLARAAGADVLVAGALDDQTEVFGRLAARAPERVRVVHALAAAPRPGDVSEADHAARWLDLGFHSALTALQTAARLLPGTAVDLVVVTRDMQDVTGDGAVEPAKAAVLGLVKLAPKEFDAVTCRSVDFGAAPPSTAAAQLLAEVTGNAAEEQVAYRGRKRWVWSFAGVELSGPGGVPSLLKERGVYVVTGGLGGLGLLVAGQLASLVSARLVLVGRTGLPPREEWPAILDGADEKDRVAARIRGVLDVEAAGGEVLAVSGDVTDEASMDAVKRAAGERFGPVDGVFHLAAVAGGGMLETRSRADAARVLAPKVLGAYVVERVFEPELLVLYSSIAAVSGDFGLGDYAGANAVLDAFAQSRWARGRHTVSVNWPPFAEAGMAFEIDAPSILGSLRKDEGEPGAATPVAHPLLRDRRDVADGSIRFELEFTPDVWVLDEHRLAGVPTMPGTGIVELVRAAFAEVTGQPRARIGKLLFLAPLMVAEGLVVRLTLTPAGRGYDVAITGSDGVEYSRGHVEDAPEGAPAVHDLAALRDRCPDDTTPGFEGLIGELRFGPRWHIVSARHSGGPLELIDVRLPEEYAADLAGYYLHPSVLDACVAVGQNVAGDGSYLPFGYDTITVHGPLPARVTSVLRHLDDTTGDVTTADISVVDESGRELVTVEGFSLLRVDGRTGVSAAEAAGQTVGQAAVARPPAVDPSVSEDGVRNAEAAETLRLVLASGFGPQLIWCPEGLGERLRRTARVTRAALAEKLTADTAGGGGTRDLDTPYVEPGTEPERALAVLWTEALGIDQVGAEDDFFDLGGNSLVAVQLVARITQRFRSDVSVARLFDTRTVRGLATAIEEDLLAKVAAMSDEEAIEALKVLEGE
ncbi:SDR family oxidoreductase [Planotetraspora sp. GP83]|uniref:type I polyketide synthase n=1 Tax=Planotetraspora sp. GP83 TaxID=3156264 RepID=UPI0035183B97